MTAQESNSEIESLSKSITDDLELLGTQSAYKADADEIDPRYKSYGVRAQEMKRYILQLKPTFSKMETSEKISLAQRLIASGFGEQKTVALALLEREAQYFTQDRFDLLEEIFSQLFGWSKIDAYTGLFLRQILNAHEAELIELLKSWNLHDDQWLRRASVVLFTRQVARSERYKDVALANCDNLIHAKEHLVQTGVGWCLRDLMRWHKEDILPYVIDLRAKGISSKITPYALRDIKGDERKNILGKT